jgi:xylose isomerase
MEELNIAGRFASFFSPIKDGTEEENIEAFEKAAEEQSKVPGVKGVEMHYPAQFVIPVEKMKEIFDKYNIKVSAINPRFAKDKRFDKGALSHPKQEIRDAAIDFVKKNIDAAKILDCKVINVWINRDGHTYAFERDYSLLWGNFVDSLQKLADYAPEINLALEYKYEESPVKTMVRDAGRTLALIQAIDKKNVGANVDYNHTIMAQECPGEVYDMFLSRGKLFNIHLNDSWYYDDDIMVGSNTPVSLFEVMTLLRRYKYDGWIYFDTKVINGSPTEECIENVETTNQFWRLAHDLDLDKLEELREEENVFKIHKLIRTTLFRDPK